MPDDLDWLAFCYTAGEMSREEADAFEGRLAGEQAAREAVSRAVDLTCALAAAEDLARSTSAQPAAGRRRRLVLGWLAWAAVAAAACVAIVLAYQLGRGGGPMAGRALEIADQEEAAPGNAGFEELAVLWNRTREELAAQQFDGWEANGPAPSEAVDDWASLAAEDRIPAEPHAEEDALAANVPPPWMLSAVRAAAEGPGAEDGGPFNIEEN